MKKKNSGKEKKGLNSNKTLVALIVALSVFVIAVLVIVTLVMVNALRGNSDNSGTTEYTIGSIVQNPEESNVNNLDTSYSSYVFPTGDSTSETSSTTGTNNGQASNNGEPATVGDNSSSGLKTTDPLEYYESLEKKGEPVASDDPENKYIKKISEKYGVNSDLLVVLYTVPDNGDNFVLKFNGTKDSNGNIVRSPDTLEKIYRVDKNGNVTIATGKVTGNEGVSYAEGILVFNMIKTILMPEYPDYFTGV